MKFFTKKSMVQKIVVAMILLLLVNFTLTPYYSYADDDGGWSIAGSLARELMQLLCWFGDVVMGGLNNFMLGANGFGSAMLSTNDPNMQKNSGSWIRASYNNTNRDDPNTIVFEAGDIDTSSFMPGTTYEIPNMLYSPENIFANNIAALDVNFLRENTYSSIYKSGDNEFKADAKEKSESSAGKLKKTIASWYKSFRNIAIVGLLSVLVYLGIRILISSTATDKAKYKENLQNWVVALCLVFFIHFIMSAVLMVTDKCTELFGTTLNEGYTVIEEENKIAFKTNLIGLVRFSAQSKDATTTATYTVIYMALVVYTCIFTFMYFKRFLYMAFFTMIAPLVALTYPMDKAGDGKAQAFNMWFKEYTLNAIIQPVHLILYAVFVGSAYELAASNPLYALVAIGFLIPAEKFIKKMFGLDKAETTSGFGSFAGGALAMSGLKHLASMGSGGKNGKGKGENGEDGDSSSSKGIFMPPSTTGNLNSFGAGSGSDDSSQNENPSGAEQNNGEENEGEDNNKKFDPNEHMRRVEKEALDKYTAEGYGQNANGEYFNPYTDEYDPDYNPINDSSYAPDLDEATGKFNPNYDSTKNASAQNSNEQEDTTNIDTANANASMNASTNTKTAPKPIKGYKGRMLKRGAKAVGRQVWKHGGKAVRAGARVAGAVAGGTVGLAAGLTTGDFSKTMQYAGAGAIAGSAIGANAQRGAMNLATGAVNGVKTLGQTGKDIQRSYNEEKYGYDYAREVTRQKQNQKARKEFLKNDDEQRKYRDLAAKMGYQGDVKNLMQAAADYKEAGITDDKLIHNALTAEHERDKGTSFSGKTHNQFVEVASFAHENKFSKDNITDTKKREQLDNVIDSVVQGDNNAKREAALMYADIFDSRKTYENVGKFGKNKMK